MNWCQSIDSACWGDLLDSFSEGIYITNPHGLTLGVNKAYEKITGIPSAKVLGRYMDDIVAEGTLSGSITKQVITTGKEVTYDQTTYRGKRCFIKGRPITDKDGKVILVVTVVRDLEAIESLRHELEKCRTIACEYKMQLDERGQESTFVVKSKPFLNVVSLARKIAAIDSTVLILGESGTGKEIIAQEIYEKSRRVKHPFLRINCGTIPANLLESELFGYEKGAFTGAAPGGHIGLFEVADKGTLFLDEIGDLPLMLQVKLLRVLQEKVITRIGSSREIRVDTRIIAATNEDLEKMVLEKRFRKDLYYRLNVVHIEIPPLRERTEEIPALIDFFTAKINKKYNLQKRLHPDLIREFMDYEWPGNVRELENIIERIMVTSEQDVLCPKSIQQHYKAGLPTTEGRFTLSGILPLREACERVERYLLDEAKKCYKTTYRIAEALHISQPSAFRKIKKYAVSREAPHAGADSGASRLSASINLNS